MRNCDWQRITEITKAQADVKEPFASDEKAIKVKSAPLDSDGRVEIDASREIQGRNDEENQGYGRIIGIAEIEVEENKRKENDNEGYST